MTPSLPFRSLGCNRLITRMTPSLPFRSLGCNRLLLITVLWVLSLQPGVVEPKTPPAFFIFGDSLADVGNNNYLPLSLLKANYLPNGIDYEGANHPTGRFCNGRVVLDIIADRLGFPISLPYLSPKAKGPAILQGVNYASGGCGILNETNRDANACLPFWRQLNDHDTTVLSTVQQLGIEGAEEFLSSSLYVVIFGSNDYLGNFLRNNSPDSKEYTPSGFIKLLVSSLDIELTRLYNNSARKIVLFGVGPLGCIPSQRAKISTGSCNEELNNWVLMLNVALETLVQQLGSKLSEAKITFANPYSIVNDFVQNPSTYGFTVTNEACCGGGRLHAQIPCLPLSIHCSNRSSYLFWDPWHPTEATNTFLANSLLSASSGIVGPWSITQLATTP